MPKTTPRVCRIVLAAALTAIPMIVSAQALPSWEKLKLSEQIQQLTLGGDLRLRNDGRHRRGGAAGAVNDRHQNRYRLRLSAEMKLPKDITAFARLGSGAGEQVSTNQTYGNLSNEKALWIDQVWAKWTPQFDAGSAYLTSGRMQNMLWRAYSSDVIWDDDFNPEGFQEGGAYIIPALGLTLFGNAMQMIANESATKGTQLGFSEQLGLEKTLPWETRLKAAVAYHKWSDENRASLNAAPAVIQDGNRRLAGNILANHFGVLEVTSQLSGWAGALPVNVQATLIRNMGARGDLASSAAACPAGQTCPPGRDGYQYGMILGSAKAARTWEAAYFHKYVQTDATVADIADSDFGDGGTNRQGHIIWVAYAPLNWMQLRAKAFFTETIDKQFNPGDKAVGRLQLDFSIKF